MVRLNKCLSGKAREAVAPLLCIPENVPMVMSTLKMLFGQANQIVKSLIEKTRSLPPIQERHPETIITFANSVNNLVATMTTLNQEGHLNNPSLMEELMGKLPPTLQLQWCLHKLKSEDSLKSFSSWIMEIATAATSMSNLNVNRNEKPQSFRPNQNDFRQTKRQVLNAYDKSKNLNPNCLRCNKPGHELVDCPEFNEDSIEDRWNLVAGKRLCFSCFQTGHQTAICPNNKQPCGKNGCKMSHNPLLHRGQNSVPARTNFCGTSKEVLLRVIPVNLSGPNGTIRTYALLDDGSTVTMIDKSTANSLGLSGPTKSLCLQWTNMMLQTEDDSQVVSFKISGVGPDAKEFVLKNVQTISSLDLATHTIDVPNLQAEWPHLANVPAESMHAVKPSLIIGEDNILLTIPRSVRHAGWNDPVASKTLLGWVIHGTTSFPKRVDKVLVHHNCEQDDRELNEMVKRSFSMEAFGVLLPAKKLLTQQDARGLFILESTVKRVESQFEAGLLWAYDDVQMPSGSRQTALHRLHCMERKMDKDEAFAKLYCEKINEYLDKGYAFKLNYSDAMAVTKKTFYIPHFAVTNPNKPGKIRLVFDAAAKTNGLSFNDALLSGPDLFNDLPAVLWRFRQRHIGFTGDIAEMFHRVNIRSDDLDAQRFLWRGMDRSCPPQTYVMKAMIFGATCSPTTAIYVMRKNAEEFASEFPYVCVAIQRNFYMDDYCDSADTEDEALQKISNMIEVQKRGGFHIRNWTCSSLQVLSMLPDDLKANSFKELQLDSSLPTERVLGLWWNSQLDCFTFKLNEKKLKLINDKDKIWTKRDLLKLMASIFDPLGMLAHFIIKARIIFQNAWRSSSEWDESLSDDVKHSWLNWCKKLPNIQDVRIPRFYGTAPQKFNPILHVFADASMEAYASVAYFRWGEEECEGVSFVAGKARVAPLKPMTVPRLELMAALMAVRLADTITKEHDYKINNIIFWSDSRIVLSWIRSEAAKFKQFVAARVNEIHELSTTDNWRWVPTAENPADDATRLSSEVQLTPSERWFTGPSFLSLSPSLWPTEINSEMSELMYEANKSELRPKFVGVAQAVTVDESMPDVKRFSSWIKLIRTTAWVVRFVTNLRCKSKRLTDLSAYEIHDAEIRWIRKVQAECFPEEINLLKRWKPVASNSRLYSLCPFMDVDNTIRARGRTEYSEMLSYATMFPFILDGKHYYTRLLVQYYHKKAMHMGVETVINNLREKYWITSMRSTVKLSFRSCQYCKIKHAKPIQPQMAPLPDFRVNSNFIPFDHVGIDFFGPFEVQVGRRMRQKRYGVIFTCLTIRAIHIEVAETLSTDSTIMALRRFMSRRGVYPSHIYTDNGTNFRGSCREVREAIRLVNYDRISQEFNARPISWHFQIPSSPTMGGAWERLIRSVKQGLEISMKSRHPSFEVLETMMTEVEHTVNSRPLTEVSVDPNDLRSLTPNDFLHMHSVRVPDWTKRNEIPSLKKFWHMSQVLANVFWQRWVKEYLPTLTRRSKWHATQPQINVDDIVVIADGNNRRNTWPMGKVTQVYPGRDGTVRGADVTTAFGTYRRHVSKLAKLDVKNDDEVTDS